MAHLSRFLDTLFALAVLVLMGAVPVLAFEQSHVRSDFIREQPVKQVLSLRPEFIISELHARGIERAALSMCGTGFQTCEAAEERLLHLTAQCSDVFLGIIDFDLHPQTPRTLYGAGDPSLILFKSPRPNDAPLYVEVRAAVNQNTIAIVLCPEESRAFGHVLRMLTFPPN